MSNNASTDETEAVIKKYEAMGMPIQYYKNEQNIGADGNFEKCFSKALGKYVWIFGDDELLFNHSKVIKTMV
nr:glycosyltransferase [Flavobacterium branchiophilum]